jgi:hypothetical protein
MSVRHLLDAYERVSKMYSLFPSEREGITFIKPETVAGLRSYVNHGHFMSCVNADSRT